MDELLDILQKIFPGAIRAGAIHLVPAAIPRDVKTALLPVDEDVIAGLAKLAEVQGRTMHAVAIDILRAGVLLGLAVDQLQGFLAEFE